MLVNCASIEFVVLEAKVMAEMLDKNRHRIPNSKLQQVGSVLACKHVISSP